MRRSNINKILITDLNVSIWDVSLVQESSPFDCMSPYFSPNMIIVSYLIVTSMIA